MNDGSYIYCADRMDASIQDMFDLRAMTSADEGLSWRWRACKRRRLLSSRFFEEGDILCHQAYKQIILAELPKDIITDTTAPCEMHYNCAHRHLCSACHRAFPSNHLLELHLHENHDIMFQTLAQKKAMYACLVSSCESKFMTSKKRHEHMIVMHKYPANYRFDRPANAHRKKKENPAKSAAPPSKTSQNTGEETMETDGSGQERLSAPSSGGGEKPVHVSESGRRFVYSVPKTISFGAGVSRGFQRGRGRGRGRGQGRGRGHGLWYQKAPPDGTTAVNIEEVTMQDLSDALS